MHREGNEVVLAGGDPVALLPHRPPFRFVDAVDELVLEVTMDQLSARGGWGQATASVDGKPACRARIFFVLAAAASGNGTAAG